MRVAKSDALNESPGGREKGADTGPRGATTLLDLWVSTKNVVQPDAKSESEVAFLLVIEEKGGTEALVNVEMMRCKCMRCWACENSGSPSLPSGVIPLF